MISAPCVSIVVPVYNAAHFLPFALDSAFAQTFQDFEILIVDDGSTDDLARVLDAYAGRVQVHHQQNAGPSTARNRGIRAARGEFIAFLDADDVWEPQKLALQVAALRAHAESALCFTDCLYFDADKAWPADLASRVPPADKMFEAILTDHFIPLSSVVVRRTALDEVGLFDETLIGSEDYNLYLRLARRYKFEFVAQALMKSRFHEKNLSHDLSQMCRDEIANIDKMAALFPELKLRTRPMAAQVWFRFGQYHFDAGDFAAARGCFVRAIRGNPRRPSAYTHWLAAALPARLREFARGLVRRVRGTRQSTEEATAVVSTPVVGERQ